MTAGGLTKNQLGKIHATFASLGIVTDRSRKLAVCSGILYRLVESTTDLSFDEAHVCIEVLVDIAGNGDESEREARLQGFAMRYRAGAL